MTFPITPTWNQVLGFLTAWGLTTFPIERVEIFGGFEEEAKRDCAARYLLARECQYDNAPECDATECGDPYNDMLRCVELIGGE